MSRLAELAEALDYIRVLRAALALAEVEVCLERSWCRMCRTEGRGDLRGRSVHPHATECVLYRPAPTWSLIDVHARDPDHPCHMYSPGTPGGDCEGDGHYLCRGCSQREGPALGADDEG